MGGLHSPGAFSQRPARGRPTVAVAVIAAALLAGLATPWFADFDEAAYADVAWRMASSGDWLRPVLNCQPFYEKPALFYWLVAPLFKLFGLTPVAPRMVSACALLLGLAWIAREVTRWAGHEASEAAVWVAGASLLPFTLGRIGLLDALLTTTMAVALLAFLRGLAEDRARGRCKSLALGYVMTGVALAVKGPAFPIIAAGVLLCDALVRRDVRRTLRRSGLLWGAPLILVVGLPPYLLTALSAGPASLAEFLGEHNLGRALAPMQGHGGSPLYYLVILAAGLLPFSAFLPTALLRARQHDPGSRHLGGFAAVWGLVVVVAFSLAATKLPNYVAPAIPAFAIVMGLELAEPTRKAGPAWSATVVLCMCFSVLIAALPALLARLPLLLGPEILKRAPELVRLPQGPWPRVGFFLAGCLLAGGSVAGRVLAHKGPTLRAIRVLGVTGALTWSVFLVSAGDLLDATSIQPVRRLAATAAAALPSGAPIYVVEMNHRVTQNLATGRCTVFLRARTSRERELVRAILARDGAVRMLMGETWWEELRPQVGGRELARDGAWVLVTGDG